MSENSQGKVHHALWILLLLFFVQFALCFSPGTMAWDGVFYYAYTRSTIFDGDLRLGNDLLLSYDARHDPFFEAQHFEEILTPTGRVDSPFAIGASLLWLPWFALIRGLVWLAGWVGLDSSTLTGYEWPFVWGMATVTCVYGWVSVLVGFRLARKFVNDWAALVASVTVMFATPLLYYQLREPFYAHVASAMTTALFVAAWWHFAAKSSGHTSVAFLVGMLGGLAALVRWQNVTYLVLPILMTLFADWSVLRKRDWRAVWHAFLRILLVGLGALLVLTLQVAVWYIFYGRPLTVPQGAAFMDWSAPWIGHVLFSAFHGLLPWMPLALPSVIGLILFARRTPRLSVPLVVAFLLQVYLNSCVRDWFGAGGYGARRFSNTLAILLTGYAFMLDWRKKRWYRLLVAGLSGLLILHQWLILRYGFADQIGGHVISMAPIYQWHADSLVDFGRQLASYIPRAMQSPLQALILSPSPLRTVQTSFLSFGYQILLLVGVLGVLYLLQVGCRWLRYRYAKSTSIRCFLLTCVVALIVLADWWLLKWA
jgi:hypothetical protein